MPKIHTVAKAQKDYPEAGIVRGDTYYWYKQKIMSGGGWHSKLTRTKTMPAPGSITQSPYQQVVNELQKVSYGFQNADTFEELDSMRVDLVGELEALRDEQQEKLDNLPESLQSGPTGELLQERYDALEEQISALNDVDVPDDDAVRAEVREERANNKDSALDDDKALPTEEENEADFNADFDDRLQSVKDELEGAWML